MGAEALGGGVLDVPDEVLGRREVDVRGGAELAAHVALLGAAVDGDDVDAHGARVLDGHAAQAAARPDHDHALARPRPGLLQPLVHGDAGAQDRRHRLERALLRDPRHVRGLAHRVLLEAAVHRVPRQLGRGAERLVGREAETARVARAAYCSR